MNKNAAAAARGKVRKALLQKAREMARSGAHTDHRSIIAELARVEDAHLLPPLLDRREIRHQLNLICDLARAPRR